MLTMYHLRSRSVWKPLNLLHQLRTFINVRLKWIRDPDLDTLVSSEIYLIQCLTLKNIILSLPPSPSVTSVSIHKPLVDIRYSVSTLSFLQKYPSLFNICPRPYPTVGITSDFLALHQEEESIHMSPSHRHASAIRLSKFLMLTKACKMPLFIINDFKFDLGLPFNYLLDLVPFYPEFFRVCSLRYNDKEHIGLELVKWRPEFATPAILRDFSCDGTRRGRVVRFPMSFTPGFDLRKRVIEWVEELQCLPYISPYENAFHLLPRSVQAEKWTLSVLHEILSLLISKKTRLNSVLRLGDYLGFGRRFKRAVVSYPGMFYYSNKNRTQTLVLREGFTRHVLLEKHPLMGMRHRYLYLMSKSEKRRKRVNESSRGNGLEIVQTDEHGRLCADEEETDMEID